MKTTLAITIFAGLAALGCAKQETAQAATASPAPTAPAAAVSADAITGPVLETMDAGGYTYMKLQTATGETWVATPQTPVKVGQTVTVDPQMTNENFESSSLKRTFDRIVFATMAGGNASAPTMPPAGMGGMGGMMGGGTPADHMKPKVDVGDVNVPKAEGANAYTVSDIWTSRTTLGGKDVAVRGKVVKFLGGIMGTNFVHVRDGSGSDAKGDNDLTITTNEQLAVGDVVTITGKVSVDKDLGAGYKYPVIVENATVTK